MDTFIFQPRKPMRYKARVQPPLPGPPPTAAVVIAASVPGGLSFDVYLQFDRPLVLIGEGPWPLDGQIQVNDSNPIAVGHPSPDTLQLTFTSEIEAGQGWNVNATPQWCATELAVGSGLVA